jgi:hypothetical protein
MVQRLQADKAELKHQLNNFETVLNERNSQMFELQAENAELKRIASICSGPCHAPGASGESLAYLDEVAFLLEENARLQKQIDEAREFCEWIHQAEGSRSAVTSGPTFFIKLKELESILNPGPEERGE